MKTRARASPVPILVAECDAFPGIVTFVAEGAQDITLPAGVLHFIYYYVGIGVTKKSLVKLKSIKLHGVAADEALSRYYSRY